MAELGRDAPSPAPAGEWGREPAVHLAARLRRWASGCAHRQPSDARSRHGRCAVSSRLGAPADESLVLLAAHICGGKPSSGKLLHGARDVPSGSQAPRHRHTSECGEPRPGEKCEGETFPGVNV